MNRNKLRSTFLLLIIGCLIAFGSGMNANADDRSKLIEKMIKQLTKDKKADSRSDAAKMLGDLKAVEAVPALAAALKDPDNDVRWNTSYSLFQIAPDAKDAIPALKEALSDSVGSVRLNAAAALSKMDVPDQDLAPSIRELLKDRSAMMRVKAADMLLSLSVPIHEVLPVLLDGMKDPDAETQERASKLLVDAGELPKEALPSLITAMKASSPKARENVIKAIGKMGLTAGQAVPALIQALHDSDSSVRGNAADALGSIGPGAKAAVPELASLVGNDVEAFVRKQALRSLYEINAEDPAALPAFIKALKDPDEDVRRESLEAFREIQPLPAAAIAALKETAAGDTTESIRFTAQNLLKDAGRSKTATATQPTAKLSTSPRPQIEPLREQLDKQLDDTPAPFKNAEEAKQYLHERSVEYNKDEFWSNLTQGYGDVVEAFLMLGMSPNTSGSSPDANPLQFSTMACADAGEAQIALMLLAYGADPNVQDEIKRTPILSAAAGCPFIVVKALLISGARTDVITDGGFTVLAAAVQSKNPEVVRAILNSGYKITKEPSYLYDSAKGNAEIQQMLLKAGVKK